MLFNKEKPVEHPQILVNEGGLEIMKNNIEKTTEHKEAIFLSKKEKLASEFKESLAETPVQIKDNHKSLEVEIKSDLISLPKENLSEKATPQLSTESSTNTISIFNIFPEAQKLSNIKNNF